MLTLIAAVFEIAMKSNYTGMKLFYKGMILGGATLICWVSIVHL